MKKSEFDGRERRELALVFIIYSTMNRPTKKIKVVKDNKEVLRQKMILKEFIRKGKEAKHRLLTQLYSEKRVRQQS